jgi:predicted permease
MQQHGGEREGAVVDVLQIFFVVLWAIAKLTVIVLASYLLFRSGRLSFRVHAVISKAVLYVFLPMLLFATLAQSGDLLERYPRWYVLPLSAWMLYGTGALIGLGLGAVLMRERKDRPLCAVMSGFNNSGYLPLAIIAGVFPQMKTLPVLVMIYVIGSATMLWSVGPAVFGGGGLRWANVRKVLNPPIVAVLCGFAAMVAGLGPWLEGIPVGGVNLARLTLTPLAWLGGTAPYLILVVLGGILAKLPSAALTKRRFVATVILSKLIALPLLGLLIIPRLGLDAHLALVLMVQTMQPPALNLSVQAREFGDPPAQALVGEGLLFTYVTSAATLTLFLTILKASGWA